MCVCCFTRCALDSSCSHSVQWHKYALADISFLVKARPANLGEEQGGSPMGPLSHKGRAKV